VSPTGFGRFASAAAAALRVDLDGVAARITSPDGIPWRSELPVAELALDSVALSSAMLERVRATRRGEEPGEVVVDARRVAASFGSERLLRIGGETPQVWAALSGFWRARDGWVRTHGNYPHHAARLRAVLGLTETADRDAAAAAIAKWRSIDLEDAAGAVGAIAAAVRTPKDWARHPQAQEVARVPLIGLHRTGDAPTREWERRPVLPLSGVRVLDLTRVIAGPVATRDLALAGADVLRVDSPHLREPTWQIQDTGQHKRATLLDLGASADRAAFDALLATADVLVTGYRPGALDLFGLSPGALALSNPGLVVASLSAWGDTGPWGHRRGFDSIVQASIGIAVREAASDAPGALPVQALDHGSGHLLAAGITAALQRQRAEGGSWHVSVALARTGLELLNADGKTVPPDDPPALPTVSVIAGDAEMICAPPVLGFAGAPTAYEASVPGWGSDAPTWRERAGGRASAHAGG
jgi:crotonobetainyl-CoA:carnitine CoA-transferase CaiB-like acyl-CoA transferase